MALVRAGFPLLIFTQNDESRTGVAQLAAELAAQGADVLLAGAGAARATILPTEGAHPVIEPLLFVQSFYRMAMRCRWRAAATRTGRRIFSR